MVTGVRVKCEEARGLVIGTATTITGLVMELVVVVVVVVMVVVAVVDVVVDEWFDLPGSFDWARSDLTGVLSNWADLVVNINRSILRGWVSSGRKGRGRARCSLTSIDEKVI